MIPDEIDVLRAENARLRVENECLRDANKALESDVYNANGNLAHAEAELAALRADIEAGRLVRVPCREVFSEAGNVVYLIYEGEAVEVVHCGATLDADGKVFVRLAAEDKIFQCRQPDPEHDTDPTDWCSNVIDILADNYSKDVFPTEQAARAAMEDVQ